MKNSVVIFICFLCFILHPTFCIAQRQGQAYIDSLLQEFPKAKEDTNKINLLIALSFGYYTINPDEGIKYGEMGLKLAEKLNWKKGIAKVYNSLGLCKITKSNYPEALEYLFKALEINEELNEKNGIAANLNNIGLIYRRQSDYPKALEYYFKSLKINEELNYTREIALNLGNIGNIYDNQSDYPKALEYYFKSLKINEELNDKTGIARSLGNIGIIYKLQSDYPKALEYYFKALKINEELNRKKGIAINFSNIGKLYLTLSQDTIYNKIHERNEFIGLTKEINLRKGIEYSLSAEKICKEINDLSTLILVSKNLCDAYKGQGNYLKALEYHEQYKTIQDSVFNQEKANSIANLEARRENELKEKKLQLQIAEIEKKNWQLFGSSTAILLMLIFSFFVIRERRKSEKLLLNILPTKIANRLKKKEHPIADHYEEASVVFIDIVEFTKASSGVDPKTVVSVLNVLYTKLDAIAKKHGLEKIKTIGDCYMAAAGIPVADKENAIKAANFAIEAMNTIDNGKLIIDNDKQNNSQSSIFNSQLMKFRCGVDCGPVVAGVIGEHKFIYDIWGDAVNTASRMEEYGEPGKIQVTERFKEKLTTPLSSPKLGGESTTPSLLPLLIKEGTEGWFFTERGEIEIKGKGMMKTYFLEKQQS